MNKIRDDRAPLRTIYLLPMHEWVVVAH